MQQIDLAVIGGGIVGLATAYQYSLRHPGRVVAVIEKETRVAAHQTGRNSGVLHSGIYYKPGSLRARNGRAGKLAMVAFCREQELPFDLCGKVIVAVSEDERPRLRGIFERGQQNGVQCELIGPERLRELEPAAAGVEAIHVPEAGIVSFTAVSERLAQLVCARGGLVRLGARVVGIAARADAITVTTTTGEIVARRVVNCGGLFSDRLARLGGQPPRAQIVPFRGEYYELVPAAQHLCRNLIYPVPDPAFPFLGVHFTRMIEGGVECGPNAVFAFAREGYGKFDVNVADLAESLTYPGFLKLAARHWRMGLGEMWRSLSKAAFVRSLQRLVPAITGDLLVAGRSGVRAQALGPDGAIVDDFLILEHDRIVNVCNAPSPAATSALNIGQLVVERLGE